MCQLRTNCVASHPVIPIKGALPHATHIWESKYRFKQSDKWLWTLLWEVDCSRIGECFEKMAVNELPSLCMYEWYIQRKSRGPMFLCLWLPWTQINRDSSFFFHFCELAQVKCSYIYHLICSLCDNKFKGGMLDKR